MEKGDSIPHTKTKTIQLKLNEYKTYYIIGNYTIFSYKKAYGTMYFELVHQL